MLCRNVLLTIKEALWADVALPVQGDPSFTLQIVWGSGYTVGTQSENHPVGNMRCPGGHLDRGILGVTSTLELHTLKLERRKTFKLVGALHIPSTPNKRHGFNFIKKLLPRMSSLAVLQNFCQTDRCVQEYLYPQEHPTM